MAENRPRWGRPLESILSMVSYSVGLGNIWRFPYLCYKSGGGAFLIPFFLCVVLIGIPVVALEACFGQFGGQGPMTIWSINPVAKGLGMAAVTISAMVTVYYCIVLSWSLRFLIASFTTRLPWEDCRHCHCLLYRQPTLDTDNMTEIALRNLTTVDAENRTIPYIGDFVTNNTSGFNCSLNESAPNFASDRSPSDVYFWDYVLKSTASINETGEVAVEVLLCNLLAFAIVFLVLVKGIQSLGKVVYFTATFPFLMLTILLIRGVTLEGAGQGVKFFFQPDWERLFDGQVWCNAAMQVMFSFNTCNGVIIVLSSYNHFNYNAIRNTAIVSCISFLISLFVGSIVFSTIGHMAYLRNTTVDKVTAQGPGLIFVVYPEVLSTMPVAPVWSVLFFFMVCILGFNGEFSAAETVMTSLVDQFPHHLKTPYRRAALTGGVSLLAFLLGIPMVTGGGIYLVTLVDEAVMSYPVLAVGLAELFVIATVYGYGNLAEDIESMMGHRPSFYLRVCWTVVTPFLFVVVMVLTFNQEQEQEVAWASMLRLLIIIIPILFMPAWALYYTCTHSQITGFLPAWRARRETASQRKSDKTDVEDVNVAEKDSSVAEKDSSVAEKDVSVAEKDVSVAEKDVSVAEKLVTEASCSTNKF